MNSNHTMKMMIANFIILYFGGPVAPVYGLAHEIAAAVPDADLVCCSRSELLARETFSLPLGWL
jgi:hypothetical protein